MQYFHANGNDCSKYCEFSSPLRLQNRERPHITEAEPDDVTGDVTPELMCKYISKNIYTIDVDES